MFWFELEAEGAAYSAEWRWRLTPETLASIERTNAMGRALWAAMTPEEQADRIASREALVQAFLANLRMVGLWHLLAPFNPTGRHRFPPIHRVDVSEPWMRHLAIPGF